MSDITKMTALEQSQAMAEGRLSAVELMDATLAQIAKVNPAVNAVVSLRDSDELKAEARAADEEERKGWLHGVPMAVKDLADAEGLPTSRGSPLFAGKVAAKDEIMVARMRAAGAIIIGKTNTPEWGLGSHTFNPVFGATQNPYKKGLSAGGSSGGAAAALAARMVSVADGSDMMGSLRNPGAWNNVYGFRPTYGRVPSEPLGDTFLHQLATLGPMARNPRDMAALLDVQQGGDPRQPHGAAYDSTMPEEGSNIKGLKLGWLGDWGGAFPMEKGLLAHSTQGMAQMEALGADVEALGAPFSADAIWESWTMLRSWQVAAGLAPFYHNEAERGHLKTEAIWEIERGLSYSAIEVHKASAIRSDWLKKAAQLFEIYDALVLPTTQLYPFPVEWTYPKEVGGAAMDTYHRWMQIVTPPGLLGLPCINVPLAMSAAGLPAGITLFGPRNSDAKLMQIGQAWHEAYRYSDAAPEGV